MPANVNFGISLTLALAVCALLVVFVWLCATLEGGWSDDDD